MVAALIIAAIGGAMNWIRGGNALGLVGKHFGKVWQDRLDVADKLLNDILFALVFLALLPGFSFAALIALFASMLIGRAQSWGAYYGNIIKQTVQNEAGVVWIDRLIFAGKTDYPKIRSTVALSLVGLVWATSLSGGLLLAYAFNGVPAPSSILLLPLAGLAYGPIVLATVELCGKVFGQEESGRNKGWGFSDIPFGVWLWGLTALLGVS